MQRRLFPSPKAESRSRGQLAGALLAIAASALATTGCSTNQLIDVAMSGAPRHPRKTSHVGPYEVLAGDMHCHVLPPDADYHVSRELPETVRLASDEGLDFVVLTPHVPSRFFLDPEEREWVRGTQKVLRARAEALSTPSLMLIPGMEYTDHRFGHVGLAFADVDEVLDELSPDMLTVAPQMFFERWRAHGGLSTINHPVLRPLPRAPIPELRFDLSWRGFPRADAIAPPMHLLPEISWLTEHADTIETHNLSIGHLRDQFMVGDPDWTMREGTHLVDRTARIQERRITPVGGTDSHGDWLRPTTWVLATDRTPAAVRDAIAQGRVCVRAPEACSLEVRGADGAFHTTGASIQSHCPPPSPRKSPPLQIEARASGGPVTYFVNGAIAAHGGDGELVAVAVPGTCAIVRAVVGASYSAPVYVDCPWASRRTRSSMPTLASIGEGWIPPTDRHERRVSR